jgi:hypothetical protein
VKNKAAMELLSKSPIEFAIKASVENDRAGGACSKYMAGTRTILLAVMPRSPGPIIDLIMVYHWDLALW